MRLPRCGLVEHPRVELGSVVCASALHDVDSRYVPYVLRMRARSYGNLFVCVSQPTRLSGCFVHPARPKPATREGGVARELIRAFVSIQARGPCVIGGRGVQRTTGIYWIGRVCCGFPTRMFERTGVPQSSHRNAS